MAFTKEKKTKSKKEARFMTSPKTTTCCIYWNRK